MSHFDNFNKEFEELRVKISHHKAISILRNINKANKKLFVESAILHYYHDIKSGKITSNSITFDIVNNIEEQSPSPAIPSAGMDVNSIVQLIAALSSTNLITNIQTDINISKENEDEDDPEVFLTDEEGDQEVSFD